MLQLEFLQNLERMARKTKEHVCRRRPTDLMPTIIGHRGEDPVVQVTLNKLGIPELMIVANLVAGGLECDAIGLVHESFMAHKDNLLNPMTGEIWDARKNEMQIAVQQHDALGKGWLVEVLMMMCVNRAGDIAYTSVPYKFVGSKHLYWIEDDERIGAWTTVDADSQAFGNVPSGLRQIMAGDTIEQWLAQDPQMSQQVADVDRDIRDAIVAKQIANRGHLPMLFAKKDSVRATRLREFGATLAP